MQIKQNPFQSNKETFNFICVIHLLICFSTYYCIYTLLWKMTFFHYYLLVIAINKILSQIFKMLISIIIIKLTTNLIW